jgi:hypothetical protein
MIGHRSHAGFDHLGQPKLHPPVHIVCLKIALQRPHEVVEPALDGHILGQSAKDDHRDVRMGVDEAGHCQQPIRVNRLAEAAGVDFARRLHGFDATAANQDVMVRQEADFREVSGDLKDGAVLDEQVRQERLLAQFAGLGKPTFITQAQQNPII